MHSSSVAVCIILINGSITVAVNYSCHTVKQVILIIGRAKGSCNRSQTAEIYMTFTIKLFLSLAIIY